MATAHYYPPAPPITHALPRPHGADAVALLPDDGGSDSESVAESSCPRRSTASGSEEGEDADGCSSCVEVDEYWGYYQHQYQQHPQEADDEEEVSTASVWWKKKRAAGGAGGVLPSAAAAAGVEEEEKKAEDPKRAAARQEEDRKFWADCLATGYP